MSEIPGDLKFLPSHEWARLEDDGNIRVGISDHAQGLLGDLVFVELPEPGDEVAKDAVCAVVESVKAASDVYAPVGGEIVAVNEALVDAPEKVNESPFDEGWLFLLSPQQATDFESLLSADDYAGQLETSD